MKKARRISLSTTQIILSSFLLAILVGTALLSLPISSKNGVSVGFVDALFTATTSTCVTGLVTLPTVSTWSVFGQIVILLLIQIGGLGIITVMAGIMLALNKRMGLSDRVLLQDAFNLNTLSGLSEFLRRVLCGTAVVEAIGALLYMTVFVRDFGARGIWISIFTSVSAFCNAGIDIFSEVSLVDYAADPIINAVTCALIILGGLGFVVWWDVIRVAKDFKKKGIRALRYMTLHSKIAILTTVSLIILGALGIFLFEYNNPRTMAELPLIQKIQLSLFQSVTTRTAGFATLPQQELTNGASVLSLLLMFIGGSPVGTAGGIKTVTIAVLVTTALSVFNNKNVPSLFHRTLSRQTVNKAIAVTIMSLAIVLVSTILLCAVCDAGIMDILYETVSAAATVGLSRGLTPSLNTLGKLIITATMYLGRVGPISLAIAFMSSKENKNIIKNPTENVSVG